MKLLIQHTTPIQLQININMLNCSTYRLHEKFQFLLHAKIVINYFQSCIIRIIHNNCKLSFTNHHSRNTHNKNKNKNKREEKNYTIQNKIMFNVSLTNKKSLSISFFFSTILWFFFFFFFCGILYLLHFILFFCYGYYFYIIFSSFRYY